MGYKKIQAKLVLDSAARRHLSSALNMSYIGSSCPQDKKNAFMRNQDEAIRNAVPKFFWKFFTELDKMLYGCSKWNKEYSILFIRTIFHLERWKIIWESEITKMVTDFSSTIFRQIEWNCSLLRDKNALSKMIQADFFKNLQAFSKLGQFRKIFWETRVIC